jgi:type III pantothenate kinase
MTVLLAVDIGNSTSVFGLVDLTSGDVRLRWEIATDSRRTADEWHELLAPLLTKANLTVGSVSGAIMASVVPRMNAALSEAIRLWWGREPLFVTAHLNVGIELRVENPLRVGADRIVDAVAAYSRLGGPVIVVDAGTATKIDAVATGGAFLGGAIAPGIGIGRDALANRAAQLSAVPLTAPPQAIGRNTTEAVQSGVVLGHVAMIEGMVNRVREELGAHAPVVLTGGIGHVLHPLSPVFDAFEPNLALEGLRLVWLRWRGGGESSL